MPERRAGRAAARINADLAGLGDDPEVQRLLARGLLMEAAGCPHTGSPAWRVLRRPRPRHRGGRDAGPGDGSRRLPARGRGDHRRPSRRGAPALRDLIATSEELGDDLSLPTLLGQRSWLEGRAGNWDLSDELLREAVGRRRRSAPALGEPGPGRPGRDPRHAGGHRRRARRARRVLRGRLASRCRRTRSPRGGRAGRRSSWPAAGSRRPTSTSLRAQEEAAGTVVEEPGILQADAPFMDCAIALGRLDEAAEHLRFVVDWTRRVDNPSVRRRVLADRGPASGGPR